MENVPVFVHYDAPRSSVQAVMIRFETTLGSFTVELFDEEAPLSAQNFRDYVAAGFYDGTIFHRVIPGLMIQGGGFTAEMQQKKTRAPIRNEAGNGVKNRRGTLSMARTNDPHSATSQFFVNLVDNAFLDPGRGGAGYAVFGCITDGMNVIDAIAAVKTGRNGGHDDVPNEPVVVTSARSIAAAKYRTAGRRRNGETNARSRPRAAARDRHRDARLGRAHDRRGDRIALGRPADERLHASGSRGGLCLARPRLPVPSRVARSGADLGQHGARGRRRGGPEVPAAPGVRPCADQQGARRPRARPAHA